MAPQQIAKHGELRVTELDHVAAFDR